MHSDNTKQRTLFGSVQSIQPSSTQQFLGKIFTMVNVQHTRDKELTIQRRWMKGHGKKKSKKKANKTHNKQVSVFSALWLCQSLLILGHSALNLNILPKCKLINQQNTRLDAHYFSHIKMWEGRKKTPQKQNQGKHTNSGLSL